MCTMRCASKKLCLALMMIVPKPLNVGKSKGTLKSASTLSCHASTRNLDGDIKMKRSAKNALSAHEDEGKLHLQVACKALAELKATNFDLQKKSQEKNQTLNNGSTTFALTNYQERKERDEEFISAPFYTHPNGYLMAIKVYVNGCGDGEGTHVSVYASLLDGKYDAGLQWPLSATVTISLLNQCNDRFHLTRMITSRRGVGSWGRHKFICHCKLNDNSCVCQFLKEDTLYFRVAVEVAGHKSWLPT